MVRCQIIPMPIAGSIFLSQCHADFWLIRDYVTGGITFEAYFLLSRLVPIEKSLFLTIFSYHKDRYPIEGMFNNGNGRSLELARHSIFRRSYPEVMDSCDRDICSRQCLAIEKTYKFKLFQPFPTGYKIENLSPSFWILWLWNYGYLFLWIKARRWRF